MVNRTIGSRGGSTVANSSIFTAGCYGHQLTAPPATDHQPLADSYGPSNVVTTTQVMRRSGTIRNLYVYLNQAQGAGTLVFTLLLNGNPTALTVTMTGVAVAGSDLVNTVAVVAGDLLVMRIVSDAVAPAGTFAVESVEFLAGTTNFSTMIFTTKSGAVAVNYLPPMGALDGADTEPNSKQLVARAGTIRNLYVYVTVGPAAGTSWTYTLYVNSVATALTCTIANPATSAEDAVNAIAVVAGDFLSIRVEKVGAPAATIHKTALEWHE